MSRARHRWLVVLVVASLALGGCDAVQWTYNNARVLLLPKLKNLTDWTDAQKTQINQEFDRYMGWHRRTMLPAYAALLRKTSALLDGATPQAIDANRQAWSQAWLQTMQPTVEPAARLLSALDARQLLELEKNFAEEDGDARKDLAKKTPAERQKKRDKELVERIDDWSGGLTDAQQQALSTAARAIPLRDEAMVTDRQKMRVELMILLRKKAGAGEVAKFFGAWFDQRRRKLDAETGPAWNGFLQTTVRVLDAGQRRAVQAKLAGYVQDCEELAH